MTDIQSLELARLSPAGAALYLKPGDRLCRINGVAFSGTPADLAARLAAASPLALGFRRGDVEFAVLAQTSALGEWAAGPALALAEGNRIHPDALRNWEVLAARDGCYDIQPLPVSGLALLATPLWLLQMRLWGLAAALAAAVALAFAVTPWLALPVHALAAVHVGRAGAAYVRADRRSRGMQPAALLAARTESEAHAAWATLDPKAHFLFARIPASPGRVSA